MSTDTVPAATLGVATARLFRVLGDPTRLRILELLLERPHSVSELVEATAVAQARVSTHLACLRWCDLVATERRGRQVIYTLRDPDLREVLEAGQTLAAPRAEHLATCGRIGPEWV